MKAELVPMNGDPPIPITRDLTLVGRREYCDLVVPHASLSKRHCVIIRTDGLLVIRDLITTNGTKVNGQRVMWAALLPNDRLALGRVKFRVYLGPDDMPSPSEQVGMRQPVAAAPRGPAPPPPAAAPASIQEVPRPAPTPASPWEEPGVGFEPPSSSNIPASTFEPPGVSDAGPARTNPPGQPSVFEDDDLDFLD